MLLPPPSLAVRGGFLHLAEALAFRRDADTIGSIVRAVIATLRSDKKYNVEPEVVSKGGPVPLMLPQPCLNWGQAAFLLPSALEEIEFGSNGALPLCPFSKGGPNS